MSPRRNVLQFVGIIAALALIGAMFAGPASAKRMSSKQKAHVRAQLRKQIKKNPRVIRSKSFIKKASLVNFVLPVTIALRGASAADPSSATKNPNKATIDLGASLGQREIDLGGKLAAEIRFHDSFDGGALGNVDLAILPSTLPAHQLTSTSIPLLWNTQVSDPSTRWDATLLKAAGVPESFVKAGCGDFTGTSPLNFGTGFLNSTAGPSTVLGGSGAPSGAPGFPYDDPGNPGSPDGFVQQVPDVNDDINSLVVSKTPGNPFKLGGTPNPFPDAANTNVKPYDDNAGAYNPSVRDTVLRTGPLSLGIAPAGTEVNQSTGTGEPNSNLVDTGAAGPGPQGSQNLVIGQSGGQANLFGNIPGKNVGIDVTVNLATKINSILRIVDQDSFGGLVSGNHWPAGVFTCRQTWTGYVQNYIPSVHLTGSLKIAPGVTAGGKLRIAKATISTPNQGSAAADKARVALAACLMPHSPFSQYQLPSTASAAALIPTFAQGGALVSPSNANIPTNNAAIQDAPTDACNTAPDDLVHFSAPGTVNPLGSVSSPPYSTTANGSQVSVAGDLTVNRVDVDVIIGNG